MLSTIARDDDAMAFGIQDALAAGTRAAAAPRRVRGWECAALGRDLSRRPDWEAMVNRLLDWADAARRLGRPRRADDLVGLAWEAYERMHP